MAKTTIVRPATVTKDYTLGRGFYAFFTDKDDNNIIDGWRIRDITKDANTAETIDISDQTMISDWREFFVGLMDAGTATVRCFYDPRKEMPTIANSSDTIKTANDYNTMSIAMNDPADKTGSLLVVMECDAILQSWGNIESTFGEVMYTSFVFKLSGEPTYYPIEI